MLLLLLLIKNGRQRFQSPARNDLVAPAEREDQHVHVARRAGEPAEPRELGREVLDVVGREHVLDLAEQRARAADGHSEVVQEFGVEIGAKAGLVGQKGAEERQMNFAGRRPPRGPSAQVSHEATRGRLARRRTSLAEHHAEDAFGARLDAGATFDDRDEPPVHVLVPAQTRQRDDVGSSARHCAPSASARGPTRIRRRATVLSRVVEDSSSDPYSSASACSNSRRTPITGASACLSGHSGRSQAKLTGWFSRYGHMAASAAGLPDDRGSAVARSRGSNALPPAGPVRRTCPAR